MSKTRLGYLVALPPGVGKTRMVLDHAFKGKNLQRVVKQILILGPNANVKKIWLREMVLKFLTKKEIYHIGRKSIVRHSSINDLEGYLKQRENSCIRLRKEEQDFNILGLKAIAKKIWLQKKVLKLLTKKEIYNIGENIIRCSNSNNLESYLKERENGCMQLRKGWYCSFRESKRIHNLRPPAILIIDEWHRLPACLVQQAKDFMECNCTKTMGLSKRKNKPGGYPSRTYFVSATPMNPVLEEEDENIVENPRESKDIIWEGRKRALSVIGALTGQCDEKALDLPFVKAIRQLKIKRLATGRSWESPIKSILPKKEKNSEFFCKQELIKICSISIDSNSSWRLKELMWATGLIRTNWSHKIIKNANGRGPKRSFGFEYESPYIADKNEKPLNAVKWLNNHPRVKRLLILLKAIGVINATNDRLKITNKKAVIFCIHKGVAEGLKLALNQSLKACNDDSNLIACTTAEFNDKLINSFNEKEKPPYVMIVTDRFSESIDLHGACNHIIHYELPWSPLRLFQRVGRLTRRNGDGYNKAFVSHIIIPGSVEEERINRLIRRTILLKEEGIWPKQFHGGNDEKEIVMGLIGSGPSLHLQEYLDKESL